MVASAEESFGFSESDIWTAHELSAYNTEVLFKRGLAKMAVAAISYKISHLIGEVATTSKTHKKERKMLRKSIVQLSVKRKNAMNYLRSRMEKFSSVSKSFVQQDLILRIVANCFDEFLSDVPHPRYRRKDFNEVHKRCLAILSSHTDDIALLQELLAPPGNKQNDITLAFTINEIFLSGNMPKFKEYLNSYVVFKKTNPHDLTWGELVLSSDARNEVLYTLYINLPFFLLCTVDISLRGIAQVYLCNHPVSGLLISFALFLTAPELFIFALIGCLGSTITSYWVCKESWDNIQSGLCGYDGTLVGCATYTFVSLNSNQAADISNAGLWYAFILAGVAGIVHSAASNASRLPALTAAFNVVMTMFMVSVGRGTSQTAQLKWSTPYDTNDTETTGDGSEGKEYDSMTAARVWRAMVLGIGQFIFVNTELGAVLVLTAICICSRKAAVMAVLGSMVGTLVSLYVLDVPHSSYGALWTGLYSYNSMGTAVALGGDIFYVSNMGSTFIGMIGAAMAAFIGLGVESFLATDGLNLPVMTIPFVATAWLIMATKSKWLVATVAESVDLDDAMFMDRRRDTEEQAALKKLLTALQSSGMLSQLLSFSGPEGGGATGQKSKYGALNDDINFENDSLLDNDDLDNFSSDKDDEEEVLNIEMV